MPVGPVTGETANLLISSVAANTQAKETTAVHQPDPASDWLRKLIILFMKAKSCTVWVILEVFKQVFVTKPWDYLISNYVDYLIYYCSKCISGLRSLVLLRATTTSNYATLVLYSPGTGNIFSEEKKILLNVSLRRVVVRQFLSRIYALFGVQFTGQEIALAY